MHSVCSSVNVAQLNQQARERAERDEKAREYKEWEERERLRTEMEEPPIADFRKKYTGAEKEILHMLHRDCIHKMTFIPRDFSKKQSTLPTYVYPLFS